jgi:hypothetical protein
MLARAVEFIDAAGNSIAHEGQQSHANVARVVDCHHRTGVQVSRANGHDAYDERGKRFCAQALDSHPNDRRRRCVRKHEERVEIGVQRDHHTPLSPSKLDDFRVGRLRHSDFADVDGVKSAPTKRRGRAPREPLIEQ